MATKVIKEIIIMLLVSLITMLILAIVLYQYVPSKKNVPEITKYTASAEVQDLLEDDINSRSNNDKVILTYEVTTSDLNNYQSTNIYVPGKSNPFATYSAKTVPAEGNQTEGTENSNNTSSNEEKASKNVETSTPKVYEDTGAK